MEAIHQYIKILFSTTYIYILAVTTYVGLMLNITLHDIDVDRQK